MAQPVTETSPVVRRLGSVWPWGAGVISAVVAIGPGLGPGSLLNLDLVLTPTLRVPAGVWGLGPGLPQRVPVYLPQVWLSSLIGGPLAGKLVMVAAFAAAFAGVVRLTSAAPVPAQVGAGVLYALGPYALTRASVGHLNVLVLLAILPWALPVLLRPGDRLARTYLAALGLSLAGSPGGATAALVLAVGLVFDRGRRTLAVAGAFVVSTLVWLAPSASVLGAGAEVSDAADFATTTGGLSGTARILVGGGFWRPESELGAFGPLVALFAVVVVVLAGLGHRDLPERWRDRALAVGLVGLVLTVASALPGLRVLYEDLTELPVGAPFRESQRSLLLWLAWLAPASSLGAARAYRWLHHEVTADDRGVPAPGAARARPSAQGAAPARPSAQGAARALSPAQGAARALSPAQGAARALAAGVAPLVLAVPAVGGLLLSSPGLWGAEGAYQPADFPVGWAQVKERVDDAPGTVLALPWKEYLDISFAGGRRCLNPLADYLGGDVLTSYDPEFGRPVQEQVDRRADQIDRLLPDLMLGRPASEQFRRLGIRWVVLTHESTARPPGSQELGVPGHSTWERYRPALSQDDGLDRVYGDDSIDLYRVEGWVGPVATAGGTTYAMTGPIPPWRRTEAPSGSVWATAGTPGWFRGLDAAEVTNDGLLRLSGRGPIWFGPGVGVLAAYLLVVGTSVLAVRRLRHRRPG